MEFLYHLVLVLHLLGWAIVLGGTLVNLRPARLPKGVVHGALTALVTGLIMVGLAEAVLDGDVNHVKIGIKLVVALVVTALAIAASRKRMVTTGMVGGIAALTALNIAIAVLWR